MRDDLLDAEAAVDWAISQGKVLVGRMAEWRRSRPYVAITEPDSQPGYEIVKAKIDHPLPLMISAETGAIIHMIRSALDMLAVTLAARNNEGPEDVYFPIAKSLAQFIDPKHGAINKIAKLSIDDRLVIENLKPYKGGDDVLFSLHQLDIMRKHRRLLAVHRNARSINITRPGHGQPVEWILEGGNLEDGTPLARVPIGANYKIQISPEVMLNEPVFGNRRPVTETLRAFGARATQIIRLFDK